TNTVDTGKTITTSSTGLSIVAGPNAYVTPSHTGSFIWLDGNRVRPSIIGTGSVTVSGGQPVLLAGVNSFSGGLNITNGGIVGLEEYGASAGDPGVPQRGAAALGSGSITLDGGTIRALSTASTPTAITVNNQINLGAGGGTFLISSAIPFTINGAIT